MPTKVLPPRASLSQLKAQAHDLMRDRARGDPLACQRLREFHPRFGGLDDAGVAAAPLSWSDALFAVAREYGFASWRRLKLRVEGESETGIADAEFAHAVELIDDGDVAGLKAQLAAHPRLATARVGFEGVNYFRDPPLLAFVAENPVRNDALPPNIVEVAAAILDAGGVGASEALGLVASGRVARECGVQGALIALLSARGGDADAAMAGALAHGEFAAVEALLEAGARFTLAVAAATGDARLAGLLAGAGEGERHFALALAVQHGRVEAARALLDAGESASRYNPVGIHSHSTPLHQAAWNGDLAMVRLLVERGARRDLKDALWQGTPLDWAVHGGREDVAAYLRGLD